METITDHTNVSLSIAVISTLALGLIVAVWRAANFIRDLRDAINRLDARVQDTWSRQNHERWARELEKRNPELDVPEVPPSGHMEGH